MKRNVKFFSSAGWKPTPLWQCNVVKDSRWFVSHEKKIVLLAAAQVEVEVVCFAFAFRAGALVFFELFDLFLKFFDVNLGLGLERAGRLRGGCGSYGGDGGIGSTPLLLPAG